MSVEPEGQDVEPAAITIIESGRLHDLERVIESARLSFIDAGEALREIRDGRLYRATHGTFDVYCDERWGWSQNYANRLVAACEAVERIRIVPIGTIPTTESQARELVRLEDPEQQVAAWEKVVERAGADPRKITAKMVKEEVAKFLPEPDDDPFNAVEEGEVIRAWLKKRALSWPERFRPTFAKFLGGIVAEVANELAHEKTREND